MPNRSALRFSMLLSGVLLLSACGKQDAAVEAEQDQATQTYGYGPVPNPAVTYQPDVVMVGGGPKAIRSASADGMVWVIDGKAQNAAELRPGKIMMASSLATGRIMSVEPAGEDVAVTLGPVHLGEILRDADLKIDAVLDPETFVYQSVPEMPGMLRDYNAPSGEQARMEVIEPEVLVSADGAKTFLLQMSPIRLAAAQGVLGTDRPTGTLPMASKTAPKIGVGDWEMEVSYKRDTPDTAKVAKITDRVSLKISRKFSTKMSKGGLKAGIEVALLTRDLHFRTHTVYRDGKLDQQSATVIVDGLEGFDVSILSGIEKAAGDNAKVRIEVPIELNWQLPPAATEGVPMTMQLKFKFLFETALGGANATLRAAGKYQLSGPLGLEDGKVVTPTAEAEEPIIETLSGVSLGVSGLIFTVESRFLAGIGVPALLAGPYVKMTAAFGLTKSADVSIGMMPQCHGSTVKIDGGAGFGYQLKPSESEALKKLLGSLIKSEWEVLEQSNTFYRKDSFSPDVPACYY